MSDGKYVDDRRMDDAMRLAYIVIVCAGREKLELGDARVRVVLEIDGTHVDDAEYFTSLPENTVFLFLRQGEHWYPAGVEAIRQGTVIFLLCSKLYRRDESLSMQIEYRCMSNVENENR